MTKITKIEVHQYTFDNSDMSGDRIYTPGATLTIGTFAVRIMTDDGLVGEFCPGFGGRQAVMAQVMTLAPALIGRDPFQREAIYDDCKRLLRQYGFLGYGAIDICLWDMAGKAYGASISKLLGGFRTKLPTYASTSRADKHGGLSTPEAYADFAEECYELGYRAYKIHGWNDGNAKREAEAVLKVAERMNGRMALMLDPACEMRTFADALYVGRACDEGNYFWYEDPSRDAAVSQHMHRKLRQMIRTPLLITEHVRGLEAKTAWITGDATDFVRADLDLDMGITGAMKIAHLAEAFGLDVELHCSGPHVRAAMSAIRNTNYYELAVVHPRTRNALPPVYKCGYSDQLRDVDKDGCFPVPTGPGLGVDYDWDFISKRTTAVHTFG